MQKNSKEIDRSYSRLYNPKQERKFQEKLEQGKKIKDLKRVWKDKLELLKCWR